MVQALSSTQSNVARKAGTFLGPFMVPGKVLR